MINGLSRNADGKLIQYFQKAIWLFDVRGVCVCVRLILGILFYKRHHPRVIWDNDNIVKNNLQKCRITLRLKSSAQAIIESPLNVILCHHCVFWKFFRSLPESTFHNVLLTLGAKYLYIEKILQGIFSQFSAVIISYFNNLGRQTI